MQRILIGSPIKQKANILKEFLLSLEELDKSKFSAYYYFVDDNTDEESSFLLSKFAKNNDNVIIKPASVFISQQNETYECNKHTHMWKKNLIERIIAFKDAMIEYAKENDFDYLFFIDSDIVLNPITINHLIKRNVDIVSNVFWTSWKSGAKILPQVWLQDDSKSYIDDWDSPLTEEQKKQKTENFVQMLKIPGIYKVGGLGACTLINKKAIQAGISFSLIDNLSFWGEDRHFCIRARVLGLNMYVDTVYPAYHIYREEYLSGVSQYKEHGFDPNQYRSDPINSDNLKTIIKNRGKSTKNLFSLLKRKIKKIKKALFIKKRQINNQHSLTVSMIVHNEEKRYLREVLEKACEYADSFVIIDDASTDKTVELCHKVLKNKPHKVVVNDKILFSNEYKLRQKQWKETIATNPDWILFLDADEILENKFKQVLPFLMANNDVDAYSFRVFDMWNKNQYREDALWQNHLYHRFMVRYQPKFHYKFIKAKQHCGRLPANVTNLQYAELEMRVKHYGWANAKDRENKYDRYMQLDQNGLYGNMEQYKSILDKNPRLIDFTEEDE